VIVGPPATRSLDRVAPLRPHESKNRTRLRAHSSRRLARPRTPPGFKEPGRDAPPERVRGAPPPWFLNLVRHPTGRRSLTVAGAIIGVLLIIGVSGARVVRQDIGHVGVIKNGGPLDTRSIRQIVDPGAGLTWTGWFSQSPHEYPAAHVTRTYTLTADATRGARNESDVAWLPTEDGVQVGVEATLFYHFIGELDKESLKDFDRSYGTRRFPVDGRHGSETLYPWQGEAGWNGMLDTVFRPVLENDMRREIGRFGCAELLPSCKLVRRAFRHPEEQPGTNIARIERAINHTLESDLANTLGHRYFWGLHFRIAKVTLPENIQTAIDRAQASYANVADARAKARQATYQDRRNKQLADTYDRSPALANIEALKALKSIPKGSTVILSGGGNKKGGGPQVLAGAGN
jgi:regulator of protease activity HflC (stomatin/prohibitin superfamily)